MERLIGVVNATAYPGGLGGPATFPGSILGPLWATVLTPSFLGTAFAVYAVACSSIRFRAEKRMRKKFPMYTDRQSLASMSNNDAQQIVEHIMTYEFPFVYKTSLQFAIVKTYAFETMSRLMVATKSFSDPRTAPKRYEDTTVLFAEFTLNAPTSERCIKAISRINYLHSQYKKSGKISNDDFLYTLSVCVSEPISWIDRYEWRKLNDMEKNAIGTFWKGIGDSMEIEYKGYLSKDSWKDGIEFAEDITAWAKGYEERAMKPAKSNRALCQPLMDMLLYLAPGFLKPFAEEAATALMEKRMREAFLYPEPRPVVTAIAHAGLWARKMFLRYLALPRIAPKIYLSTPDPKTGRINHYDYLVEPLYQEPTFWNRWGPMALFTRLMGGYVPGDTKFLPQGYLFEEVGPEAQFGKGKDAMQNWHDKMKAERPSGCPFAL
ncbi:hypothetical protein GQ53DRAFT_754156 [Thozetella sp. PMI_491]|nr:hypothetical protein GQ53DRAFT_754156 [Thozetella sp. PMI_491]